MRFRLFASVTTIGITVAGFAGPLPSFPGNFLRHPPVATNAAERECLSLGDDMYDSTVAPVGACRALGLHDADRAGGLAWIYGNYERRWLLTPTDTVAENEIVLYTRRVRGDASGIQPVWHYRYESDMLASVTPELAPAPGGAVLLSIDECVNGTGGCSQSFAILNNGSPKVVRLAFLDSLNHRFPDGIRHGFHVDVRTLRGSLPLYSGNDANCCPSRIAEFALRLRGSSFELATLRLRRAD